MGPPELSPALDDEKMPKALLPRALTPPGLVPFSSSISVGPVKTLLATFTLPPGPKCGPSTLPSLHSLERICEGFMGSRQTLYPCLQTGAQGGSEVVARPGGKSHFAPQRGKCSCHEASSIHGGSI